MKVLFVCTGNICRSPMAERMTAGLAEQADLMPGGRPVEARSAGVGAMNGQAIHPYTAEVLVEHGFDPTGFESRYLRPTDLQDADVVLCMTRRHRAACQQLLPVKWKRMFTLVEFAELTPMGTLDDVVANRVRIDTNAEHLDIVDPMGQPKAAFDHVYSLIEPQVHTLTKWIAAQD